MDYKYIEQLLERYWTCETSLEEETILRTFFSQENIPAELLRYKDLFVYEQMEKTDCLLGKDFDERILEQTEGQVRVKAKTVRMTTRLMPLFKAAAMVALVLTLGNASQHLFNDGTATDAPGTAEIRMPVSGSSVAMKDSVKVDTMKKAMQSVVIIK
ncbi:pyruvate ferredoxin oxidoreductase [Xylanibacter caecicola]|uniref:pyruvate ferredoxin oxidoreductase n=1 Tax=Xylanibacter caecicola TaxID=2736294 RepID=UPI00258E7406|nr:pyruvate ferredoxin oxidoreductase [Xylanibacter caecicola]